MILNLIILILYILPIIIFLLLFIYDIIYIIKSNKKLNWGLIFTFILGVIPIINIILIIRGIRRYIYFNF